MNTDVDNLYNRALELAEISRLYIEDNMYVRTGESNEVVVENMQAMSMITYMLTNIIAFLLLNKAYAKGEIPKDQINESAGAIMSKMAEMQVFTSSNDEIQKILAKLDVLMLEIKKLIVN